MIVIAIFFPPWKHFPRSLSPFPGVPAGQGPMGSPCLSNWWLLPSGRIRPVTSDGGDEHHAYSNPPLISWPNLPDGRGRIASLREWKWTREAPFGSNSNNQISGRRDTGGAAGTTPSPHAGLIYKPFLMWNKCHGCEFVLNHKNPCVTLPRIKYHI